VDASTGETITAIATAFAAVGTVGALWFAAWAARSASSSAKTANESVQAEARPLLLDVPYEHYTDYEHEFPWPGEEKRKTSMRGQIVVDATDGTFVFPVRNVGRGVALVEHVEISVRGVGEPYRDYSGLAVPVGEDAWLSGKPSDSSSIAQALKEQPSPVPAVMPYFLTAGYTDIGGKQKQRLVLVVGTLRGDSSLRVLWVEHDDLSE
jgi:hypothetical protein